MFCAWCRVLLRMVGQPFWRHVREVTLMLRGGLWRTPVVMRDRSGAMSVVAVVICDQVLVSVFAYCGVISDVLRSVSGVIGSVGIQPFCWHAPKVTLM
jgi:hypothetical protein